LANVFSSGKILDSRFGIVYFPQRWLLQGMHLEKSPLLRDENREIAETQLKTSPDGK
jgi:anti-sigma factor ChrR (cupin superfamily)